MSKLYFTLNKFRSNVSRLLQAKKIRAKHFWSIIHAKLTSAKHFRSISHFKLTIGKHVRIIHHAKLTRAKHVKGYTSRYTNQG